MTQLWATFVASSKDVDILSDDTTRPVIEILYISPHFTLFGASFCFLTKHCLGRWRVVFAAICFHCPHTPFRMAVLQGGWQFCVPRVFWLVAFSPRGGYLRSQHEQPTVLAKQRCWRTLLKNVWEPIWNMRKGLVAGCSGQHTHSHTHTHTHTRFSFKFHLLLRKGCLTKTGTLSGCPDFQHSTIVGCCLLMANASEHTNLEVLPIL